MVHVLGYPHTCCRPQRFLASGRCSFGCCSRLGSRPADGKHAFILCLWNEAMNLFYKDFIFCFKWHTRFAKCKKFKIFINWEARIKEMMSELGQTEAQAQSGCPHGRRATALASGCIAVGSWSSEWIWDSHLRPPVLTVTVPSGTLTARPNKHHPHRYNDLLRKYLRICLFERQGYRERRRGGECWLPSQTLRMTMVWAGPQPRTRNSVQVSQSIAGPSCWGLQHRLPELCILGSWISKPGSPAIRLRLPECLSYSPNTHRTHHHSYAMIILWHICSSYFF